MSLHQYCVIYELHNEDTHGYMNGVFQEFECLKVSVVSPVIRMMVAFTRSFMTDTRRCE